MENSPKVEEISNWLVERIADRLDMENSEIDLDARITDYGLSSREAIMLSGELEDWLGFDLPPELLYEYPVISELAPILAKGPAAFEDDPEPPPAMPQLVKPFEIPFTHCIEAFRDKVSKYGNKTAVSFLPDTEFTAQSFTYAELEERAKAIAATLQAKGLEGRQALLLYPSGLEYVAAFLGCLYAGVTAVPAYPPKNNRVLDRVRMILQDLDTKVALIEPGVMKDVQRLLGEDPLVEEVQWLVSTEIDTQTAAEQWRQPEVTKDTLAFLQYTSGSTGNPKGVMVSHGNIVSNCAYMQRAYGLGDDMCVVGWLPIYHDMGLIGQLLCPLLILGGRIVFMDPATFSRKPAFWLQAISHYRANTTVGPNFAFDYCAEKVTDEQKDGLDLSTLQVVINGSEPVQARTLDHFTEAFASCGFNRAAFFPSYGMAESTLLISTKPIARPPVVLHAESAALEENKVLSSEQPADDTMPIVSCGPPDPSAFDLHIVDTERFAELAENRIGEIWIAGASVAQGYWKQADLTEITFRAHISDTEKGPFFRTGDLGFLRNGELFITGRLKDLIIIRGRNYYPQDIEDCIQRDHPLLTTNGGAAFSVEVDGTEQLVIVQEVERIAVRDLDAAAVFEEIQARIAQQFELQVYAIELLSPRRLFRTTSGKVRRRATKLAFLKGELEPIASYTKGITGTVNHIDFVRELGANFKALHTVHPSERVAHLIPYLQEVVGALLKTPSATIDADKPLINFGLDSINAMELKNIVENVFGFELDVTSFLEGLSIRELAEEIVERMGASIESRAVPQSMTAQATAAGNGETGPLDIDKLSQAQIQELLTDIDALSPEEVEKLIEKLSGE